VLETFYRIPHGMAVVEGMRIAAELSAWTGDMSHTELRILDGVLEKAGMTEEHELPPGIIDRILKDKKSESGTINMVLLRSVGKAMVKRMKKADLEEFVSYYRDSKVKSNRE